MFREYWVYQKRNVFTPWALYIVKEYERNHPERTTLDITLYHEDIGNSAHSISIDGIHHDRIGDYVSDIEALIYENTRLMVKDEDIEQLEIELLRIFQ